MTCDRCEDMHIIDPIFLEEAKAAVGQLLVDLILHAKRHKINHTEMPVLASIARTIQIIESL